MRGWSCYDLPILSHSRPFISVARVLSVWVLLFTTLLLALPDVSLAQSAHAPSKASRRDPAGTKTPSGPPYGQRPDVRELADQLAQQHQLPRSWARQQLAQARQLNQLPRLVLPPAPGQRKNWAAYRERFIEPRRLEAGVAFWREHQSALARAESRFGVPASLIVGVLGVETYYGRHMGNYRVIDALTTLSLDFPDEHPRAAERRAFFRSELGHFLVQLKKYPKRSWRGSYAGAMGWPQFMPSSWAKFAVDFDGDGQIDLMSSPVDAIGSVANYFKAFGWKTGLPTHYPMTLQSSPADLEALLTPDILPTFSLETFQAKGVQLPEAALQYPGPYALVELQNGDAPNSYVAGTENFYVVTRYNWSSYYAMAVMELGQTVAERMGR
jgi:membrane-bound lytic murein transglycosylase B